MAEDNLENVVFPGYRPHTAVKSKAEHHKEAEGKDMDNWGDGLILGALFGGRGGLCGGHGGCGGGHHVSCGETLEGISRTLHTNDLRNEARLGRIECRLDHVAEKICSAKEQALELFIKHQEKENCKLEQKNMFLEFLGKGHNSGSDTNINIGNQLSALTSAVNSVLGKVS